jgi:dTDP-4-amino-4,6-dideoxygalactose transaminase
VIEDAACAIGSEILWNGGWEKIGAPHADIACFSFHPRKLVSTGDGGMITTRNGEWDLKFRLWRQHGMSVPDTVRHGSKQVVFEDYLEVGFNFRMTDVQAAIGREQLKRLPAMIERRQAQADRYRSMLSGVSGLGLPETPVWARRNWQSYCVRLPARVRQRVVMQRLLDESISTRRGVMCSHREPAYASAPWNCGVEHPACGCVSGSCRRLVESERAQDEVIILPLYHEMTEEVQERVVAALVAALV